MIVMTQQPMILIAIIYHALMSSFVNTLRIKRHTVCGHPLL